MRGTTALTLSFFVNPVNIPAPPRDVFFGSDKHPIPPRKRAAVYP